MKKISQISWHRYLESEEGQAILNLFTSVCNIPSAEDILSLALQFDPQYFANSDATMQARYKRDCQMFIDILRDEFSHQSVTDQEDFDYLYLDLISELSGVAPEEVENVKDNRFRGVINYNIFLSTALYCFFPKYCIPNFYPMQFGLLKRMAAKYEIELPELPKSNRYWDRNMYYLDLCDVLRAFAEENGLSTMAELCTFLYGYELPLLREELESGSVNNELPAAAQVWLISGTYLDGERNMDFGFWQANAEIKRGDILVFYEKAPTKAINSIWRAESDGCYDPFFYYSSYTFIGHKIQIPPISIETLRDHSYFSTHPMATGNFERLTQKHFNSEDYSQLKDILTQKGFDCSILPKLKAHEAPSDIDFSEKEGAVHKYLVLPLLESMGWTEENGHILNQVVQHVGRGESRTNGRTDVSLHPYGQGLKKAKVVIEEKYWMRNESERLDAFEQGLSYARLSESNMLVICDKAQIVVFPKTRDSFSFDKSHTFYWDEMQNPDKFCKLRKLFS